MGDSQSDFIQTCIAPRAGTPGLEAIGRRAVELAHLVRIAIRIADDQGYMGLRDLLRRELARIEGTEECSDKH